MSKFHNPYQFAPVDPPGAAASWKHLGGNPWPPDDLSHAAYASGRLSGRLLCLLTVETPLVIGGAQESGQDGHPTKVKPFRLGAEIALPASSLRGLLSSLAEAASGSAMRVLEDRTLSYRKTADDALRRVGMLLANDSDAERPFKIWEFSSADVVPLSSAKFRNAPSSWVEIKKGTLNVGKSAIYRRKDGVDNDDHINYAECAKLTGDERKAYQRLLLRNMSCDARRDQFPSDRSSELGIPLPPKPDEPEPNR